MGEEPVAAIRINGGLMSNYLQQNAVITGIITKVH